EKASCETVRMYPGMVRSATEKSAAFFRVIVVFKKMEEPDSCIKTSPLPHEPVMETIIKGISSKIKSISHVLCNYFGNRIS
ncbi:MAG TPA: hypothetical protein DD414_12090, partial [Lachnospiraceae bacterium]|nr:hypothetical protein [Lachnospiraceae bacterium]